MKFVNTTAALLSVVTLVACSNSKADADAALKAVGDAYDKVKDEAETYTPDRARELREDIVKARTAWGRGNYDSASRFAEDIPKEIEKLMAVVAAKKQELAKQWPELSTSVPPLLAALGRRVEAMSKSAGRPGGLSQPVVDNAKSQYASATKGWDEAMATANAGDLGAAALKGGRIKENVTSLMTSLKIPLPKS